LEIQVYYFRFLKIL